MAVSLASVGRLVASDTIVLWFESSQLHSKGKIKDKRGREWSEYGSDCGSVGREVASDSYSEKFYNFK